jgi:hypothetical protein
VIWSVNGIPGGNATVGTIEAQGLCIAPATLPNPNSVNVTATSAVEPFGIRGSSVARVALEKPGRNRGVHSVTPIHVLVSPSNTTLEAVTFSSL